MILTVKQAVGDFKIFKLLKVCWIINAMLWNSSSTFLTRSFKTVSKIVLYSQLNLKNKLAKSLLGQCELANFGLQKRQIESCSKQVMQLYVFFLTLCWLGTCLFICKDTLTRRQRRVESSCHQLASWGNPVKCLTQGHNKRTYWLFSTLSI